MAPSHRLTQHWSALLGLLVAGHGQAMSAGRLIDELWEGEPPPTASTSLQVAISRIRRITDANRATRTPAIRLISVADGYGDPGRARDKVDVWQFETDARTALAAGPQECVSRSETALARWRGAPYADCADTELGTSRGSKTCCSSRANAPRQFAAPNSSAAPIPCAPRAMRSIGWSPASAAP